MKVYNHKKKGGNSGKKSGSSHPQHNNNFNDKWKSEAITEEFFSCKDFESLASFEVLTDYNLVQSGNEITSLDDGNSRQGANAKDKRKRQKIDPGKEIIQAKKIRVNEQQQQPIEKQRSSYGANSENSISEFNNSVDSTSSWDVFDDDASEPEPSANANQLRTTRGKRNSLKSERKTSKNKSSSHPTQPIVVPKIKSKTFNIVEWTKLGVTDEVLKALEENGFDDPTLIQKLSLPATILGGKDCVGAAETGSGKTLAFAIPIILGILRNKLEGNEPEDENDDDGDTSSNLRALILTPTRELAVQIKKHIDAISTYTNINVVVIVGGLSQQKQERLLRGKPDIVIATPGRLWELVQDGNLHLSTLHDIRYLAVDETDRMVEKGHFQELQGILAALNSNPKTKQQRQNFVFSATLAFTHEPPQRLKNSNPKRQKKVVRKVAPEDKLREIMEMIGVAENAKIIDITSGKGTCETLTEMSITCSLSQKDYYLYYFFVKHPGRTIVFCNSINCVRRLVNLFFLLQCEPLALHSEMHQKQRLRNLERFAENEKGILIATDVAARGLDIVNIEHVIHYQVPKTAESYIHRSGRTARAFKGGLALALIEPAESSTFRDISRSLGRNNMLPAFDIDGKFYNEIKARVDLAIKVEQFEHMVRKKCADTNWIEKAKKEMDLASSDEDSDRDIGGKQEMKKNIREAKQQLAQAKSQLAQLLAINYMVLKRSFNMNPTPAIPSLPNK